MMIMMMGAAEILRRLLRWAVDSYALVPRNMMATLEKIPDRHLVNGSGIVRVPYLLSIIAFVLLAGSKTAGQVCFRGRGGR